ncbi:hypothetical protein VOLCADRAFT_100595 [Volvox carteri f. nagariensis]|uniref:Uncharacterized protein n=1 Tax=Volvox carteri f. nagariensis TaxID=3068 RepID=D8UKK6_VOLCA|nr:uncharacterized protein VOLCADRAFT_100595 [Volvox carteri f. nagariensis]EFJ39747.1 hypothetical protein VOLCADRAFT_100595 [Volvox carteri f. nagariensis]|eukprot:XP_002959185.1 hypothetical protein VOLCADRAFT_100595 [Volvox carteri f. nagariensis]
MKANKVACNGRGRGSVWRSGSLRKQTSLATFSSSQTYLGTLQSNTIRALETRAAASQGPPYFKKKRTEKKISEVYGKRVTSFSALEAPVVISARVNTPPVVKKPGVKIQEAVAPADGDADDSWVLDSGSQYHMSPDSTCLWNYQRIDGDMFVEIADGLCPMPIFGTAGSVI